MSVAVVIAVRLTPRAGRDAIGGVDEDGALRVRVAAPPVDDAANRALVRLLADTLDVAPTAITIVAGATSRTKRIRIEGIEAAALETRWPGLRG